MPVRILALLLLLTWAAESVVDAAEADFRLEAVPVAVSGTFSPWALAVDGRAVVRAEGAVERLTLNGKDVVPSEGRTRPFFVQVADSDELIIEPGGLGEIRVPLPAVAMSEGGKGRVVLTVSRSADAVLLNGELTPLGTEGVLVVGPGSYVLELSARDSGPGRLYNLQVPEPEIETEPPVFSHWAYAGVTDSAGHHGPGGLIGYTRTFERRWVASAMWIAGGYDNDFHHQLNLNESSVSQEREMSLALLFYAGYLPFNSGARIVDLRRLEFGLAAGRGWMKKTRHSFHTNHQLNQTYENFQQESFPFWLFGPYLRIVPLRYKNFTLGSIFTVLPQVGDPGVRLSMSLDLGLRF